MKFIQQAQMNQNKNLPNVLITVNWCPRTHRVISFDSAYDIRKSLLSYGINAYLISVNAGFDKLLIEENNIIFPVEEIISSQNNDPGELRGLLDKINIPYVGSSAEVVKISNDKYKTCNILKCHGLNVPNSILVEDFDDSLQKLDAFIDANRLPLVIKPNISRGGSEGVKYVETKEELYSYLNLFKVAYPNVCALVEQYIQGTEITVWVVGRNPTTEDIKILMPNKNGKPIISKYDKEKQGYKKNKESHSILWSRLNNDICLTDYTKKVSLNVHNIIGAYSYSRIDIIISDKTFLPYVIDVNTTPRLYANSELGIDVGTNKSFAELIYDRVCDAWLKNNKTLAQFTS